MFRRRLTLLATLALAPAARAQGSDSVLTLVRDGLQRTYLLHTPAHLAPSAPLVIVLHGRLGNGSGMARLTHFNRLADSAGIVVAYPDGYHRGWADGRGATAADQRHLDDVGFIGAVIDDISARRGIDRGRVYAAGLSNGGFFTLRLACDLGNRLAGIGVVAATLSDALMGRCQGHPLPAMVIDGTSDPLVPYLGGAMGKRGQVQSAAATADFLARTNGCRQQALARALPDTAHDGTVVSFLAYRGCPAGLPVVLVRVEDGGHAWPGGSPYLPQLVIGKVSGNFDTNRELWHFWQQAGEGRPSH